MASAPVAVTEHAVMTAVLMTIVVVGTVALAITVDVGALAAWLTEKMRTE